MNAANQQKLKDFNRRYYTPENMVLVVVGPVQPKAVRAMVDQTFGKRPRTGYAPPPAPPLAPIKGIVCKTVERPEQQAQLALGWQAQREAGDVEKAKRRILEELARLAQEGPTEEERSLAVTKAESEHAFAYETTDGVASAYGITAMTGKLEDELRYVDRLRAVTRDEIRNAARKYLPVEDYACIAFVPG